MREQEDVTLTDILIDIQQREAGASLAPNVVTQRELAVEFGVEDNPRWLLPIFKVVPETFLRRPAQFSDRR